MVHSRRLTRRGWMLIVVLIAAGALLGRTSAQRNADTALQTAPLSERMQAGPLVYYDLVKALEYVREYGTQPTNSDGCYVHKNGSCGPMTISPKADGAHFIDCALKAGELEYQGEKRAKCNGGGSNSYISVMALRAMLLTLPHQVITDQLQVVRGDILLIGNATGTDYCWAGFVVQDGTDPGGVRVAVHSIIDSDPPNRIDIVPNSLSCVDLSTDRREFLRLRYDETPPIVRFTGPDTGSYATGSTLTLQWQGIEQPSPGGSWVRWYTLRKAVNGGSFAPVSVNTPNVSAQVTLSEFCSSVTYGIDGVDLAGNPSTMDTLPFTVTLPGDVNGDGVVDQLDIAAVEAAFGVRSGASGYHAPLDLNSDQIINAADLLWLYRHLGDRCP